MPGRSGGGSGVRREEEGGSAKSDVPRQRIQISFPGSCL